MPPRKPPKKVKKPASKQPESVEVSIPGDWKPYLDWLERFYIKQIDATASVAEHFITWFLAGNGAGKTRWLYTNLVGMSMWLHPYQSQNAPVKRLPRPPLKIKILLQDFEHGLDTVAFETLFTETHLPDGSEIGPLCPRSAIKNPDAPWKKEDKSLRWHNGTVWHFMTSEQKKRQHSGTNFDILACDEEPDEGPFDESLRGLRTAKGGGRVLGSMTPPYEEGKGPSWTKFRIYEPWMRGDTSVNVIQACMMDNPMITGEFIEEFKKGKTEEQLRVQLYGQYPTWGKVCFPYFQRFLWDAKKGEGNLLPTSWEVPWDDESARFEFAIDYHQAKACAAVWSVELADGDVVVFDEVRPQDVDGKTVSEVAEVIHQIEPDKHFSRRTVKRYGDPKMKDKSNAMIRGFNAWDEFRNCGVVLHEGYNKAPGIGYSIMNDFLKGDRKHHPRLYIRENCINLINSMENHYWTMAGEPDQKFSDYCVALKYIMQNKARKAKKGMERRRWNYGLTSYEGINQTSHADVYRRLYPGARR